MNLKFLEDLPLAVWTYSKEGPLIYRGSPLEMVQQMAAEIGPEVTPGEAMETILNALAEHQHIRIRIVGDPPEDIRAGIFLFALITHGVCHPMAKA